MRRSVHLFAVILASALMLAGSASSAQTRRTTTGGGSSSSATTQTRRSSGTSTSSSQAKENQSATRSSGGRETSTSQTRTTTQSQDNRGTRSGGSSYSGGITPVRRSTSGSSSSGSNTGTSGTQIRRNTGSSSGTTSTGSTTGSSGSSTRSSGNGATTQTRRSTTQTGSTSSDTRGSGNNATTQTRTTTQTREPVGGTVRSNSNVTRRGLTGDRLSGNSDTRSTATEPRGDNYRDRYGNYRYGGYDDYRMDDRYNVHRVPPRDRGWMAYDRPGIFWYDTPHYYGYRVNYLPTGYRHVRILGIDFYIYNDIYYRRYGTNYVICRPPHGTWIDRAIDRAILREVTFAYYYNSYRTYNAIDRNLRTIAEQNRLIAENNARIAAQNRSLAWNTDRALSAYELANRLGLVQSYAYASSEYYYQDGVFYIYDGGRYQVIIPPAGALVGSLPDDYDTIVMDGIEYYKVDDTVYRTTLLEGVPYLEVLGQMYGSLAGRYNYY